MPGKVEVVPVGSVELVEVLDERFFFSTEGVGDRFYFSAAV